VKGLPFSGIRNDHLYGEANNDTVWGNSGDDTLVGGSGDDDYLLFAFNGSFQGSDVIDEAAKSVGRRTVQELVGSNRFCEPCQVARSRNKLNSHFILAVPSFCMSSDHDERPPFRVPKVVDTAVSDTYI
jgi:hypothetical protein